MFVYDIFTTMSIFYNNHAHMHHTKLCTPLRQPCAPLMHIYAPFSILYVHLLDPFAPFSDPCMPIQVQYAPLPDRCVPIFFLFAPF
jgi:hypothetical protein